MSPTATVATARPAVDAASDTPALRLVALLELVAAEPDDARPAVLAERAGLPKATVHRMLTQLEGADLVRRRADGRHYDVGRRLRALAEDVVLTPRRQDAEHAVLVGLVESLGEACNITGLVGHEVVYLDRVETPEPLRFHLRPGSRVPVHVSASGKMLLARLRPQQRRRLLDGLPLAASTPASVTDPDELERQVQQARADGYALDEEEFLPGLFCVAVPVPGADGPRPECLAVQAPVTRLDRSDLPEVLPVLREAAQRLGALVEEEPA